MSITSPPSPCLYHRALLKGAFSTWTNVLARVSALVTLGTALSTSLVIVDQASGITRVGCVEVAADPLLKEVTGPVNLVEGAAAPKLVCVWPC